MAEAFALPFHFVDHLCHPGLNAAAGRIPLNAYLSKTASNGGNDSATSLFGKLRWMKDGGTGPTMNSLVGGKAVDLALKGQGSGDAFVAIWNFMCRNKEQLKKLDVEVCGRRDKKKPAEKVVLKTGNVYDLYFKGRSDRAAIEQMIADRFFGIDCVGYVANYLLYNHEWDEYKGAEPAQWPMWHCQGKVNKASEVKALDFLVWNGHIAMVDWIWGMVDAKTVQIDVCQSSSGGPQCNERVLLKETSATVSGRRQFLISGGTPKLPVDGLVVVARRAGFFW